MDALLQADAFLLRALRAALAGPVADRLMVFFSAIGDYGLIWILCGALLLALPKYRRNGALLLAALAVGYLLGDILLKPLVGRVRPCNLWPEVPLLIGRKLDFSFPSGHAASSFAAAAAIACANRSWGAAAFILAGLVGLSRVYLFVHFPTDVLAGAALGVLVTLWLRAIQKRVA